MTVVENTNSVVEAISESPVTWVPVVDNSDVQSNEISVVGKVEDITDSLPLSTIVDKNCDSSVVIGEMEEEETKDSVCKVVPYVCSTIDNVEKFKSSVVPCKLELDEVVVSCVVVVVELSILPPDVDWYNSVISLIFIGN